MTAVRLVACGLVLVCGAVPARSAQEVPPVDPVVDALQASASRFLEDVAAGKVQSAYEQLLTGSPLLQQTEALEQVVEKIKGLQEKVGACRGYEAVGSKRLGSDVVLLRYVVKCDEFPVVWTFVFYRPPSVQPPPAEAAWRVVGVRFDTDLGLLPW